MNYVVTVNGEKYEVEVERVGSGSSSLSRRPPERVSRAIQAAPLLNLLPRNPRYLRQLPQLLPVP